jgi:hypothetical protein
MEDGELTHNTILAICANTDINFLSKSRNEIKIGKLIKSIFLSLLRDATNSLTLSI